jgi:2-polyprenyl-3-methyl-5-hydroxy-6-metoxy-1,4-benzoquinol methylase
MSATQTDSTYRHEGAENPLSYNYLFPAVLEALGPYQGQRVFDLGCGTGAFDQLLTERGFQLTGVDPSESGIAIGQAAFPNLNISIGSAYDDLAAKFGTYPAVISLEVVEHLYEPHKWSKTAYDLLDHGGTLIASTPYHGWLKNVAIAVSGKFDFHVHPLRTHGHIKFWSVSTLRTLLLSAGFTSIRFERVGRIPQLACSMIAIARKD